MTYLLIVLLLAVLILIYLVEAVYPKAIRLYVPLTIIGVVLVLGLIVYVTALDIGRIVT